MNAVHFNIFDPQKPRIRWLPYVLFAAILFTLFPEAIFLGKTYMGAGDRIALEMPFYYGAVRALRQWTLPLWNSYCFSGQPMMGLPSFRFLYPANLLVFLLFPGHLEKAATARIILELFLTLVVFYRLFLKVWKDPALAVFSSLAYTLSTAMLLFLSVEQIPSYFPGLILNILWDWEERRMGLNIVYLALSLFLLISGTMLQHLCYLGPLLFAISVARCLFVPGSESGRLRKLLFLWGVSSLLAVMLDSPELLSLIHMVKESARISMTYPMLWSSWGQPWYMSFRMMAPHFIGNSALWFPGIEDNSNINPNESFPAYAGIATFLFATVAARRPFRRESSPWILAIAILTLCSLRTPFMILPYLAFMKSEVLHGRMARLIPLCLAFLAPAGIRLYMAGSPSFKKSCLLQMGAIAAGFWLFMSDAFGPFSLYSLAGASAWRVNAPPDIASRFREAAFVFAAGAGLLIVAALAHLSRKLSDRGFKIALALFLAADLVYFARRHAMPLTFLDTSWYPPLEYLPHAPDQGAYRVADPDQASNDAAIVYQVHGFNGFANLVNERYGNLAMNGGVAFRSIDPYLNLSPRMADVLGVKYFIVRGPPGTSSSYSSFADTVFSYPDMTILRKRRPVGRFHLACKALKVPDTYEAASKAINAPGTDVSNTVVLTEGEGAQATRDWSACKRSPTDAMEMHEVRPELLRGRATLRFPALLVVSETFDPGWQAYIDGKPVPILRANYVFQAIELPAGTSIIEMRYRPPWLRLSLTAMLCSLAILGIVWVAPFWRKWPSYFNRKS